MAPLRPPCPVTPECLPAVWSGHLPYAITHRPVGRHQRDSLNFEAVGREFQVND